MYDRTLPLYQPAGVSINFGMSYACIYTVQSPVQYPVWQVSRPSYLYNTYRITLNGTIVLWHSFTDGTGGMLDFKFYWPLTKSQVCVII